MCHTCSSMCTALMHVTALLVLRGIHTPKLKVVSEQGQRGRRFIVDVVDPLDTMAERGAGGKLLG